MSRRRVTTVRSLSFSPSATLVLRAQLSTSKMSASRNNVVHHEAAPASTAHTDAANAHARAATTTADPQWHAVTQMYIPHRLRGCALAVNANLIIFMNPR